MPTLENTALIKAMIEKAEENLRAAKQLLMSDETASERSKKSPGKNIKKSKTPAVNINLQEKIIEGEFDGQNMLDSEGKTYPVPANYASKSKLISGDRLKLTIQEDGSYLYKQIGPIERIHVIGPLTYENGQYRVLANNKAYNVLLASVTYYKVKVGDKVTLIIPKDRETEWGAIDHVLPSEIDIEAESNSEELF